MKAAIPNILTVARVLLILPFIGAFYIPDPGYIPAAIFALAAATDFLDGYLSRKWQVTSAFGTMLDPIADKLIVTAALIMLIAQAAVALTPCIIILLREVFISGLREFLALKNVSVPVSKLAKWKTATQLIAIIILLAGQFDIGNIAIWVAAIITAITGLQYIIASRPHIK